MRTLVILAAGMGKRFDGGIKQLTKIYNNKTIMELSIENAKKAGFSKVIFIIREELKELFEQQIIPNIDIEYSYRYQKVDKSRLKPWGTGEAIITLKGLDEPFCLINSDDYYTLDAFKKIKNNQNNSTVLYKIKNTILHDTIINRGVCNVDGDFLSGIKEVTKIEIKNDMVVSNNADENSLVSMNIWGFNSNIVSLFEREFNEFKKNTIDLINDEFMIPSVLNKLISENVIKIKVFKTDDKCLGITYSDDVKILSDYIKKSDNN